MVSDFGRYEYVSTVSESTYVVGACCVTWNGRLQSNVTMSWLEGFVDAILGLKVSRLLFFCISDSATACHVSISAAAFSLT